VDHSGGTFPLGSFFFVLVPVSPLIPNGIWFWPSEGTFLLRVGFCGGPNGFPVFGLGRTMCCSFLLFVVFLPGFPYAPPPHRPHLVWFFGECSLMLFLHLPLGLLSPASEHGLYDTPFSNHRLRPLFFFSLGPSPTFPVRWLTLLSQPVPHLLHCNFFFEHWTCFFYYTLFSVSYNPKSHFFFPPLLYECSCSILRASRVFFPFGPDVIFGEPSDRPAVLFSRPLFGTEFSLLRVSWAPGSDTPNDPDAGTGRSPVGPTFSLSTPLRGDVFFCRSIPCSLVIDVVV